MLTNQSTQNVGSSGQSSGSSTSTADEPPDLSDHKRLKTPPGKPSNCWFSEKEAAQFREAVCPVVKTSSGQNGLDSDLKCAGCGHGAWNPRQAKCSHLWCLTCVMKLITTNKDPCCPADRTKFCEGDLRVPAQGILDKLNKLKIVCPIHKAEGCHWQGLYQDASKHITECPKSVVSCPFGCNLRYLREESDKHLSAFGVTHTRVLSERLDNEARERRQLYELISKLSDQVSALQKGQPVRVESQPVSTPVAAATPIPKSQEGESRSSISLLPGDTDKNRQAMINRLDDEEKKRAALGVLLVNEQKERLKLKNRLDDEHKERLALMRHVDLLSHQFSSIARSGENEEALQTQETIVVFGGILDGHSTLDVVEVYNPATNTWTSMSPMSSPRWAFSAAPWKGRMIVMGGGILGKKSLHTSGLWNPVGDQWKRMPSMTCNRNGCAATTVNDVVYCFGGYDGKDQLTSAEKYDEKTYTWKKITDMSTRRRGCAAVCVSGRAYVIGGYDGRKRVSAMEVYDPNTDTWKQAPPMPTKRDGCAAAAVGDRIFVCGGYDGKVRLHNAEMYDVTSKQWKVLPNMSHRRDGCAAAVVDGRVYVFGGYDGKNWLESGEVYDPVTNAWKRTAPMLTKRSYCAAVTWIPIIEPTPHSASQLTINPNKSGDHDSDSTSPGSPPHSPPHTPPLSGEIKQANPNGTLTSEMQRDSVTLPPLHPGLNMIQSRSKDSISGGSTGGSPRSSSPLPLTVSAPVPVRSVSGELLSISGSATSPSNIGTNGSNSPPSPSPQAEFNLLSPPERPDREREPSFASSLSSLAGDPRLSLMSPSAAAASSAVSNPAPSPAHGNTKP